MNRHPQAHLYVHAPSCSAPQSSLSLTPTAPSWFWAPLLDLRKSPQEAKLEMEIWELGFFKLKADSCFTLAVRRDRFRRVLRLLHSSSGRPHRSLRRCASEQREALHHRKRGQRCPASALRDRHLQRGGCRYEPGHVAG